MMEERYHATTQNRFYPDMSNVKKILQWRQNLSAHLRRNSIGFFFFISVPKKWGLPYKYTQS